MSTTTGRLLATRLTSSQATQEYHGVDSEMEFDVDPSCSKEITSKLTLLDEFWPISKNVISFKVYVSGYDSFAPPDNAFDGDFSTQFHSGKKKNL